MSDVEISALERSVKAEPNDLELRATLCQQLKRTGLLKHELALELAAALGNPVAGRLAHPRRDELCEAGLMRRQGEILIFVTPAGLDALAGLPVAKLDLQLSRTLPREAFAALRGLPLLELLLECCTSLKDDDLDHLAGMPLRTLDLSGCELTDDALARLAPLPLEVLKLEATASFTEAGLAHLRGLPLRELYLSSDLLLRPSGARHLTRLEVLHAHLLAPEALQLLCEGNLRELHTSLTPTAEGFEALRKSRVRRLSFGPLDDAGLTALAAMPLEELTLEYEAPFTPIGLARLTACPLRRLVLRHNRQVSDAALEALAPFAARGARAREHALRRSRPGAPGRHAPARARTLGHTRERRRPRAPEGDAAASPQPGRVGEGLASRTGAAQGPAAHIARPELLRRRERHGGELPEPAEEPREPRPARNVDHRPRGREAGGSPDPGARPERRAQGDEREHRRPEDAAADPVCGATVRGSPTRGARDCGRRSPPRDTTRSCARPAASRASGAGIRPTARYSRRLIPREGPP